MRKQAFLILVFLTVFLFISISYAEKEIQEIEQGASPTTQTYNSIGGSATDPYLYLQEPILVYPDSKGKYQEIKRDGNYIFTDEKIVTDAFVRNPLGKFDTKRVWVTMNVEPVPGEGMEIVCIPNLKKKTIPKGIHLDVGKFNKNTDMWYRCELTANESMYGKYWIGYGVLNSKDEGGFFGSWDYFFNPIISMSLDGVFTFENVTHGSVVYSDALLLRNEEADLSSGIKLDMYISGADFYDPSSGAKCPISNKLELKNLRYSAANGAYTSGKNKGVDKEGYSPINYGSDFSTLTEKNKIIQQKNGNSLDIGQEMSIKFKLNVPSPCQGHFDSYSLYIWGKVSDNSPFSPSLRLDISPEITVA